MVKTVIRKATLADANALATVYITSRKELVGFAPLIHSDENIFKWIREVVLVNEQVFIAERDGRAIGMMSCTKAQGIGHINQLYLLPCAIRQGVGSALLNEAKRTLGSPIQLFTFEANASANSFYEHHGFHAMSVSDGSDNEENCAAILYEWKAPSQ